MFRQNEDDVPPVPTDPAGSAPRLPRLRRAAAGLGRSRWRSVLGCVAQLHERAIRDDRHGLFPHPWEEIGPGYVYGPAFGHWDIVHQSLDAVVDEPAHALRQLENLLALQQPDGRLPVVMMMRDGKPWLHDPALTHPPVWPVLVDRLVAGGHGPGLGARCVPHARAQLEWFDRHRRVGDAYGYADFLLEDSFESGVDDGVRFLDGPHGELAPFVDASCHAWMLLDLVARFGPGAEAEAAGERRAALAETIRRTMWHDGLGLFVDAFRTGKPSPPMALEGFWPLVIGVATAEQTDRVVDDWLLNPDRFFSAHPLRTVAPADPAYETRMWRGPAWNSMTLWAALGCARCGRPAAAAAILERALNATAAEFERTGTVWEFYHPDGEPAASVARKPYAEGVANAPCRDYLGHNPLLAMARLWEECREA